MDVEKIRQGSKNERDSDIDIGVGRCADLTFDYAVYRHTAGKKIRDALIMDYE